MSEMAIFRQLILGVVIEVPSRVVGEIRPLQIPDQEAEEYPGQ